jgi:signal transduction histidine kinase
MSTSKTFAGPDFHQLFESVPNLYLVLSPQLEIVAVSEAYLRATVTQREAIGGRYLFEVFPDNPDDPAASGVGNLRASLQRVLQTRMPDTMAVQKYDIPRPDREGGGFEVRYWSPLNTPMIGADGRVEYIIHRVEDVTEFIRLKQEGAAQSRLTEELRTKSEQMESEIFSRAQELQETNEKLREAERLKSEFFANVSHELRTPLSLILAPVESLLSETQDAISPGQSQLLRTVHNNSVRLLQMINGLLDFSKTEAGKMKAERQPTDICALSRSILHDFASVAEKKQVGLSHNIAECQTLVSLDAYLFEHILFNLLSNAIKFTPSGGQIDVSLTFVNERVCLAVKDTGIGIRAEDQPGLFEKFRQVEGSATRRYEGTGLGLAMVREFAGLLGGTATVKSQPGQGSVFIVDFLAPVARTMPEGKQTVVKRATILPVWQQETAMDPASTAMGPVPGAAATTPASSQLKVLICEDNAELADYIQSLLRDFCMTRVARDGALGLQEVRSWSPDLVLSDVMMPGIDGISLCREIKSDPRTSSIVVILLTALAQRESLLRGWEAKADEYLFKPFHPHELITRVKSLLSIIQERKKNAEAIQRKDRELALAYAELEQKEKLDRYARALERSNKELEDFAYISSHDMKSPVTSLNGLLTLMDKKNAVKEEHRSLFDMTKRAALQMQTTVRLLNDTIAFRKSLTPQRELLQFEDLLEKVKLSLFEPILRSGAEIDADFSKCPAVLYPAVHMQSILQNLLSNAIKYGKEDITPSIHIETDIAGDDVLLLVRDNGLGMDLTNARDKLYRLFQRFHTHKEGMGVGLYLVRSIVEFFEGRIEVESEVNIGTTFKIYLGHAKVQ